MKTVEAPNLDADDPIRVFVAGGITGCPDWQEEFIDLFQYGLQTEPVTIYTPRRYDFDVNDEGVAFDQIAWEYDHLKAADVVVFWFPEETLCPITLFELGVQLGRTTELVVGCHRGYERRFDVRTQMLLAGKLVPEQFADNIKDLAYYTQNKVLNLGFRRYR